MANETPKEKNCSRCGDRKALSEFYIDSTTGGPRAHCIGCHTEMNRIYYERNREAVLAKRKRDYRSKLDEEGASGSVRGTRFSNMHRLGKGHVR